MISPDPDKLVTSLRTAALALAEDRSIRDLEATITNLVHAAVATVPGASGGGISRTESGTVRSSHATRDDVYALDQLQSRLGEGPCITAADDPPENGLVHANDLAADVAGAADGGRWPAFAAAAVESGYRSVLSVQLSLAGKRRSALNLYSTRADVFDSAAQTTAGLFGLQAAMLLYGADHAADLGRAVASRDLIGQAKGILMERFTVDDSEAFQLLVSSSQDTNMKLVDVARWLSGEVVARRVDGRAPSVPPDEVLGR